jgi:phosphoribosylformylglycinamidine cyclo-ligase
MSKYAQDGVNVPVGDAFSRFAGGLARNTYGCSPFVTTTDLSRGNFRGPRGFNFVNLPDGYLHTHAADGVGTKTMVAVAANNPEAAGSDLIAMTATDITRWGGLPLVLSNVLDVRALGKVDSLTYQLAQRAMYGLMQVALDHGYVVQTGETAELGIGVGSEVGDAELMFNWAGVMHGVYHPDKMILGDTLRPGQRIIVLREKSFRANGYSSVRTGARLHYGEIWWNNPEAKEDLLAATAPSVQYDRFLNRMHGWYDYPGFEPHIPMHSIIHLSGGGFESKLGQDVLKPLGLSARLDNLFEPSAIMKKCAAWRGLSDAECYSAWNGGQGALVVVDENYQARFIHGASTAGIEARVAGIITDKQEGYSVAIKSQFGSGEWIYFE